MRKVFVVAIREYLAAVKSKAFVITLVLMPVLMSLGLIAEKFLEDRVDTADKTLAVVDRSGELYEYLVTQAARRSAEDIFKQDDNDQIIEPRQQVKPRYVLELAETADKDSQAVLVELSDRVRQGKLFAFIEVSADVLNPTTDAVDPPVRYYSNTPTYHDMRRWVDTNVTLAAQTWRFGESGLDPEKVAWALRPTQSEHLGLLTINERTGQVVPAEKIDELATFIIPAIMLMFLFMVIMVGASPLIQSVLEEKAQRIAEVILASVSPFQWMMGKLLGMVGVSFTIVIVYLTGGLFIADRYEVMRLVPFNLLGWFLAYQVLAVLMFGSVFVAVGAACTDHREAQSAIMPVMIIIVIPMMFWVNVAREPSSTFSLVASLFPPATPMLMLIRQAIPPGVPLWQPVLGMVLVVLTTVLCIFAAGRIFRVGILMQGRGAGMRQMIRWVISG